MPDKRTDPRDHAGGQRIVICQDGRPGARIVLAASAPEVERHAARELQRYIHRMSGARLSIRTAAGSPGSAQRAHVLTSIFIGAAVSLDGADLSKEALGFDGFVVRSVGRNLYLAGSRSYSCLYAVYRLLEILGCGFFEDGDQVPRCRDIEIDPVDETRKPRFESRAHVVCMQDAYSGMRWWGWRELKSCVEWMAKRRYNAWHAERLADSCGIVVLAAARMGVRLRHTRWQARRIKLLRRVFQHARMMGIRIIYNTGLYAQPNQDAPGTYPYPDRIQRDEFLRRYEKMTGEHIPMLPYEWCGTKTGIMDPRSLPTQRFVSAVVQAYQDALGTDNLYTMLLPSEGAWASNDLEEMGKVTYAMIANLVQAVRQADPQASIFSPAPFSYAATYESQKRAVRDAGLPIMGDLWLNAQGRLHDFLMCDYYWGLPWITGMTVQCGSQTNPYGDLAGIVRNAREVASSPRTAGCFGFWVRTETNRRNHLVADLMPELAWNPAEVEVEDYLRRWALGRYGPDSGARLEQCVATLGATIGSSENLGTWNKPLYRQWRGSYLPGLTATSVKQLIGYLPDLRRALEAFAAECPSLAGSPLFRFDVVDIGRTYLAGIFNHRLAASRMAFRKGDRASFDQHASSVIDLMRFMARYVSVEPQFRLHSLDALARRWPPVLPGFPNTLSNWIMTTALISPQAWKPLLDYAAEDFAELIEHYYLPRVQQYLARMRELPKAGRDISGRLVYRDTDSDVMNRVSDWTTPQERLPWSAFGDTCEPELADGDDELAHQLIKKGTVGGRYAFHEGPLAPLLRELLDRFPVPEDLEDILREPEAKERAPGGKNVEGRTGEVLDGFRTPGRVELVRVPKELAMLVTITRQSTEYNLVHGAISSSTVAVSDYLKLTRMPGERSAAGGNDVAVFQFEALGNRYWLHYDTGSDRSPAALTIERAM